MKGIRRWNTADGIRSLELHYIADPERDPDTPAGAAWKAEKLKGVVGGEMSSDWRKEQEIDFSISSGMPIYGVFRRHVHMARSPLIPIKSLPMLRGWDFGGTPACAITQLVPGHFNVFPSLYVPNTQFMGIRRFAQRVMEHCNVVYQGMKWIEYVDPAGMQRSQRDERTCVSVLSGSPNHEKEEDRGFGLTVEAGEETFSGRQKAMEHVLLRLSDNGTAYFQIDPRERWIIEAFEGGYQRVKIVGTGKYKLEAAKNEYSHIMNALEYVVSRLSGVPLERHPPQTHAETAFDLFNSSGQAQYQTDAET